MPGHQSKKPGEKGSLCLGRSLALPKNPEFVLHPILVTVFDVRETDCAATPDYGLTDSSPGY